MLQRPPGHAATTRTRFVNLLQQTPLAPVLGDVMVYLPSVWRLIGFKRKGAGLDKDTAKC